MGNRDIDRNRKNEQTVDNKNSTSGLVNESFGNSTDEKTELAYDVHLEKINELLKSNQNAIPSVKNIYAILCVDHIDKFINKEIGAIDLDKMKAVSFKIFDSFMNYLAKEPIDLNCDNTALLREFNKKFNEFFNKECITNGLLDTYIQENSDSLCLNIPPLNIKDVLQIINENNIEDKIIEICKVSKQSQEALENKILEMYSKEEPNYYTICKMIYVHISYMESIAGNNFENRLKEFINNLQNVECDKLLEHMSKKIEETWGGTPKEITANSLKRKLKEFNIDKKVASITQLKRLDGLNIHMDSDIITILGQGNQGIRIKNELLEKLGLSFHGMEIKVQKTGSAKCSTENITEALLACFAGDQDKMLGNKNHYSKIIDKVYNFQGFIVDEIKKLSKKTEDGELSGSNTITSEASKLLDHIKTIECFKELINGIRKIEELRHNKIPPVNVKGMINWLENICEVSDESRNNSMTRDQFFNKLKGFMAEVEYVKHVLQTNLQEIESIEIGLTYGPKGSTNDIVWPQQGEIDCLITYQDGSKEAIEIKSSKNAFYNASNLQKHIGITLSNNMTPKIAVFMTDDEIDNTKITPDPNNPQVLIKTANEKISLNNATVDTLELIPIPDILKKVEPFKLE